MNKIIGTFIILAVFSLICPALGQADFVYIKNGDKIFGTIQSPAFSVQTPYGKVSIKNALLKSIDYKDGPIGRWTIETINNDRFSGTLLNESIQFIEEGGQKRALGREQIQRIKREISEPSYPITTTIFTMKNNDRFSGRFLDAALEIRANYNADSIQPGEINRIEFTEDYRADTTILLENGDIISGTLKQNQIRLAPDAVSELTLAKSSLKIIQFNAPKMVLEKFGNTGRSEKDGDGDGIPDFADICPDTPNGVAVSQEGCPAQTTVVKVVKEADQNRANIAVNNGHAIQKHLTGNLENILFDFNRFELKSQHYSDLDEIAAMLRQNPDAKIEIHGHTDNVGTAAYNQRLSEKRAGTVKNYFVEKGIEKDRLFPKGFGFTINRASNKNETGRALNRRVEISPISDQETLVR
jgi:outer membrane protein OmpA-like peptidoglycan-associated protein